MLITGSLIIGTFSGAVKGSVLRGGAIGLASGAVCGSVTGTGGTGATGGAIIELV